MISAGPSSTSSGHKRSNPTTLPPSQTSGSPATTAPARKKRKVDVDKLQCKHCDHKCARSNEMGNHLRKDHEDLGYKKLKCEICSSEFTSSQGLRVHMTSKHSVGNAKIYHCDKCDYNNNKEESVLVHKANHHGDAINKPQCEVCKKYFMHTDHLKKHHKDDRCMGAMDTVEEEGATSTSTRKIKKKTVPCPDCRKKFTTKVGMEGHHQRMHTQGEVDEEEEEEEEDEEGESSAQESSDTSSTSSNQSEQEED